MKLGNLSQTIVPVPNFYLNQSSRKIDTFILPSKLRQYREKDLISNLRDINISNNPRAVNHKLLRVNSEKYLPIYFKDDILQGAKDYSQPFHFPKISKRTKCLQINDSSSQYVTVKPYNDKGNSYSCTNLQLRDEIKENISHLIDKINCDIDIKRWTKVDTKVAFNNFYRTKYSPIAEFIKNNKSAKDEFKETLKGKAMSLRTINPKARVSIIKPNPNLRSEKTNSMTVNNQLDTIINYCKSNLLGLKKQNKEPFEYNKEDERFIRENQYIFDKYNKTTLYKQFPSPNRLEFSIKKIKPQKQKFKLFANGKGMTKSKSQCSGMTMKNGREDIWSRDLHKDHF